MIGETKMKTLTKITTPMLMIWSLQGHAEMPVIDITNILQTTVSAFSNIDTAASSAGILSTEQAQYAKQLLMYAKQLDQYKTQIEQLQNQSGSYGMGGLLNGSNDTATRRWAPANWRETLQVIQSGGNPGNGLVSSAIDALKTSQQVKFSDGVYKNTNGLNKRRANYYDLNTGTSLNAMGLADVAYSTTDQRTTNIESLNDQIDQATSEKAALDLSNRLAAQNLHQQNQLIQLLAVQSQAKATEQYGASSTKASESEFNDYTLGINK